MRRPLFFGITMEGLTHTAMPATCSILSGFQEDRNETCRANRPGGTNDWFLLVALSGEGYCRRAGREFDGRAGFSRNDAGSRAPPRACW